MKRLFLIAALLVSGPIWAQTGDAALDAAQAGDFEKALSIWRPLAEQGNAAAQFNLGLMYEKGDGVPKDEQLAAKWYFKAALQGHTGAQLNLGTLYDEGKGVPEDNRKAAQWYNQAAKEGESAATTNLDLMKIHGEDVFAGELPPELEPGKVIDEIVVYGDISIGALRGKVQIAEDRAFRMFNEFNDINEFEIRCRKEKTIGSNLAKRVCRPNYVDIMQAEATQLSRRGLGSSRPNPREMERKRQELIAEIVRIGKDHPELLDAMNDMTFSKRALKTEMVRRGLAEEETLEEGVDEY